MRPQPGDPVQLTWNHAIVNLCCFNNTMTTIGNQPRVPFPNSQEDRYHGVISSWPSSLSCPGGSCGMESQRRKVPAAPRVLREDPYHGVISWPSSLGCPGALLKEWSHNAGKPRLHPACLVCCSITQNETFFEPPVVAQLLSCV